MLKKQIIINIIFAVIFLGCNEYNILSYEDLSKPDAENSLQCISTGIIPALDNQEQEFIINTQEEYNGLLGYKITTHLCEDFTLPEIDFSQKTLLGRYTSGVGCSVTFSRQVLKDDLNKKVTLEIDIAEEGACEMIVASMNWTLISKIPSDYNFEFVVKE